MTGDDHGEEPDTGGGGIIAGQALQPAKTPSPALPAHLERLADRARDYAKAASAANTRRAYAAEWRHFSAWLNRHGLESFLPSPQTIGL